VDAILTALAEQHAELDRLLAPLTADDWARPTRCEGWDVADVVTHLAQTDDLAVSSVEGKLDERLTVLAHGVDGSGTVDDGAEAGVLAARGESNGAIFEQWRAAASALRGALANTDPHARVQWVSGLLSVHTLAATRLSECWIHTGDVAGALGIEQEMTDRLEHIARLAWRTVPYAFEHDGRTLSGPVAFDLRAPSGARWNFEPDAPASTRIEGPGAELCLVAARRIAPDATSLVGTGPDASAVLELVRTYA
jgi:uncharacterized protein (TIGR03084 family)